MAQRSPEQELLLAALQVGWSNSGRLRQLAQGGLDWSLVCRLAVGEGVLPRFYQRMVAEGGELVPTDDLARLHRENTRNSLVLTFELLRVLELFQANGVPVVPFKGPVLAKALYGSVQCRQFVDVDILVHRQDVQRCKELLLSLGYKASLQLTPAQEAVYLECESHHVFTQSRSGAMLELHWRIAPAHFVLPLEATGLWERLVPVELAGTIVHTFAPEDTLLMLCAHGAKHTWDRLGMISDVAGLLTVHPGINWGEITARARTLGGRRLLLLGVRLAVDILGAAVPPDVYALAYSDRHITALAAQVDRGLCREDALDVGRSVSGVLFNLRAREGFRPRLQYALAKMLMPTGWDFNLLKAPAFPWLAYRLFRPLRILGAFRNALWRRIWR
jgi:hypothetical protein